MFYLTMHSTPFIYGYLASDSKKGKPLPPLYRLLFPISRMGSYMHLLKDRIAHIMDFVTPVAED